MDATDNSPSPDRFVARHERATFAGIEVLVTSGFARELRAFARANAQSEGSEGQPSPTARRDGLESVEQP